MVAVVVWHVCACWSVNAGIDCKFEPSTHTATTFACLLAAAAAADLCCRRANLLLWLLQVLCIQGFLAARKERHRLVGLVRIMADCTSLACPSGSSSNTPSAAAAGGTARVSDSSNSSSKRGARRSSSSGGQQQGGAGLPPPASSPSAAAGSAAVVAGGVGVGSGPPAGAVGSASWPCFRAGGDRVVSALEARFVPGMAESAVVSHVLWLISTSLDAWSTRTYDYYQLVLNGIL